ncbi:hypothetical protein GcM1_118001 [Golovinomyces cichoracearum]|uniref:Uncharacterized protein n=1 Tax=Golovinomyces cichoracearum TaxID=62708 RepID=A0A420JC46_9PEZI|nr:hypothetical protein GcM1_118001 [Golovinomyces cichoracearum]
MPKRSRLNLEDQPGELITEQYDPCLYLPSPICYLWYHPLLQEQRTRKIAPAKGADVLDSIACSLSRPEDNAPAPPGLQPVTNPDEPKYRCPSLVHCPTAMV